MNMRIVGGYEKNTQLFAAPHILQVLIFGCTELFQGLKIWVKLDF